MLICTHDLGDTDIKLKEDLPKVQAKKQYA